MDRLVEILQCDSALESSAFVGLWNELTPASRSLAGVEAIALSAGLTPRRLWEVFCGAALVQSKESVGLTIALALPGIMRVAVKEAGKAKGHFAREHLFKAARVLPTPKGSTTVINVGETSKELEDGDDGPDEHGMLEQSDDFLLKASRAMHPKSLPPPAAEVEPEEEEDDESGEE